MNPLFESFQKQRGGNAFDLQSALQHTAEQIQRIGMTPEMMVRQKIQNGEMTQEQFQQLSQMANRMMGRSK